VPRLRIAGENPDLIQLRNLLEYSDSDGKVSIVQRLRDGIGGAGSIGGGDDLVLLVER
jgi:hypothetical protein